jgi:acetyl esterase/lipase/lysophospholipase L1-like esterase
MKLFFVMFSLVLSADAVTLASLQKEAPPRVIVYGSGLKLYMFPAAHAEAGRQNAAFVWIHGGGWTSGDAQSGFPHARYFASRGMVAFSVEYRLARAGGLTVADALADCRAAVAYIRAHAAELGVDPKRVAIAGDSAGAHLAGALGSEDIPNAMLLYNGIFDLTTEDRTKLTGSAEDSRRLSPLFAVHKGQAPSIVLHGLDDRSVSPDQSKNFAAAMKDAGNRCELILVEGARHAFVLPDYTAPEHQVVQAIRDGDAFLASLGYIEGGPTLESRSPAPVSKTGRWMTRHESILNLIKQGNVDLVMVGDSITENYDKSKLPDENFKPTWDKFYAPRNAVNLGISGDTTANVEWRLEHVELDGVTPKAAVILIGTNDTGHGATAEQTEAGIDEVVRRVHVKCPSTKIVLMGILPSHVSDTKSKADAEVNAYLAGHYAHVSYLTYVDVAPVFMRGGKLREELFYDPRLVPARGALHPDSNGQRMMAEALEPYLARYFENLARF